MTPLSPLRVWLGLIGLSLMASIAFLDYTIVYTALPAIQRSLVVPVITLQWIMNIFALAAATLMIFFGKLGDIFGKRKVFYIGVFIFGIAAIGAGTSPSFGWLVFFRGLQGVGAAIIFTIAAALAPAGFPDEKKTKAIGIYAAITGFGLGVGPFMGGVLVSLLSWRWIFFINIPLILIGFLLCLGNIQETVRHPNRKIDWAGLILMIVGFGGLVYSIIRAGDIGWLHPVPILVFIIGIIALVVLWIVEKRVEAPLLDLEDLKNPKVLLGVNFCATAAIVTSGMLFLVPLYLSSVRNVTAFVLGLFMLCPPLIQILIATSWHKIYGSFGMNKPAIIVILITLCSAMIQYFFGVSTSYIVIVIALSFMGAIWGLANTASITLTFQAVPAEKTGAVIGLMFTNWNMTGAVFLALVSTIFTVSEIHFMKSSLIAHHITLTVKQHHTIFALLSDPSRAHELLSQMVGPTAKKIMPLFKAAFLHGYHNIMLLCSVLAVVSLATTGFLLRKIAHK